MNQTSESQVQPINRDGSTLSESKGSKELIELEWKIITRLLHLTENASYEKHRSFYYQTLGSHIRTLSLLLKTHIEPKQEKDLAKLLSEIRTKANKIAKRLKANDRRTRKHR